MTAGGSDGLGFVARVVVARFFDLVGARLRAGVLFVVARFVAIIRVLYVGPARHGIAQDRDDAAPNPSRGRSYSARGEPDVISRF